MLKNIFGIFTNVSVIFSMILAIRKAKHEHKNTLVPTLGLAISSLSLILHVVTVLGESREEKRESNLLEKLF